MADTQETSSVSPDSELVALQEEWAPAWKIWRARRSDDLPGELPTGAFLATRPRGEADADRTVMRSTAAALDAVLRRQARG